MSDAQKLEHFNELKAGGLSDYESRATVYGNEWDTPEEAADREAHLAKLQEETDAL